jgi:hypothetical protein
MADKFDEMAQKILDEELAPASSNGQHGDGATLLDDVHAYLGRYVVFPTSDAHVATTLWVAHTHKLSAFESTPRLAFLSPEPGSGKTRALEAIEPLAPGSQHVLSASPAAIFRLIEQSRPTLLFDEVDTIFGRHGKDDGAEDLRGLLNAGHRRSATIPRCVGPTHQVQYFPVYAAVALAGLGHLPDTLLTRSVVIRMRRRAPDEHLSPFRRRLAFPAGKELCNRLIAWAKNLPEECGPNDWPWPTMPEGVTDRAADVWEPLLAIAEKAGGDWPDTARAACTAMVSAASDARQVSLGIRLLGDLHTVFGKRHAMWTGNILDALLALDEAPWSSLRGEPLNARGLASFLGEYEVSSRDVKIDGVNRKGYLRADLYDAWRCYVPAVLDGATGATSATPQVSEPKPGSADVADDHYRGYPGATQSTPSEHGGSAGSPSSASAGVGEALTLLDDAFGPVDEATE